MSAPSGTLGFGSGEAAAAAGEGELAPGTVLDGRWRIEALLGTGGMGSVYRAEHVHVGRAAALKVLHAELCRSPAERERFVGEKREEYAEDIDILHLASELVVDAVIEPDQLRAELIRRYALAAAKDRSFADRRNPITPA
jgi:acetyl-CoA carboxylase carboxyltransferase component